MKAMKLAKHEPGLFLLPFLTLFSDVLIDSTVVAILDSRPLRS